MGKVIVSEENKKPAYDEQTLAKLLEAAYVLQEHSQELRVMETQLGLTRSPDSVENRPIAGPHTARAPGSENLDLSGDQDSSLAAGFNSTATRSRVAELQRQIELRHLGLSDALSLIVQELVEICDAAGAAIGITSAEKVSYRAVAGIGAPSLGSSVPRDKTCCFPSLRTGQVFRCPDVNGESLIDAQECTRRGISSFIAVPVLGDQGIAGAIELYFSAVRAFLEQHVQTCQLMAGLVTEALSRKPASVDPMAEISSLLAHLSKQQQESNTPKPASTLVCYKCGHELVAGEQFCGQCGAARSEDGEPLSMQSKFASLWHMAQSSEAKNPENNEIQDSQTAKVDSSLLAAEVPINLRSLQSIANAPEAIAHPQPAPEVTTGPEPEQTLAKLSQQIGSDSAETWNSAASAQEFMEQSGEGNGRGWLSALWNQRRGDFYLGIAIILVICVLRWGLWSNRPIKASKPHAPAATPVTHKAKTPDLSTLDRMLIKLGLAEPPPTPEDKGNPTTAVWIDLQTGLYYCPGTDLYGKTPRGKYSSQRDAELDQFAPAYRKVCD